MFLAGKRLILAAIFLLLISKPLFAGNDPEYRQTLFGKNGDLVVANQVYTSDLNFEAYKNVTGAIERTYYVKNAIRLMIDEESSAFISSDFTVSFDLEINAEDASGASSTVTKTLSLVYKNGAAQVSGAISSYEFRDAVKVYVKIMAINSDVSWDVLKNLKLVNEIISLRDWGFNCGTTLSGIVTDSLFADEWKVRWNVPANFQTEYDVEWAWIDESAVGEYMTGGSPDMAKIFDNNATRITTSNNFYYIPLLYEDNGRLYARVRMAQIKVNGQRVEGSWFYLSDNGLAYLPRTAGHEENLNWQATTTFAEDGKRKTVIQYYDGSLRGRQTVAKDNVSRATVVAESFYDYQGRPVISVLPAPTLNTIISFTKNFNQFDDARNAKTVYDKLDGTQSACNKLTAKLLATATGSASQYYSGNNPEINNGHNKYLPDAEGYPYTETRYTSDGTGRIDAQGGIGPLFQVNSGKETKYFYESADQDDLDALFGTDAGYASHYSKTWVRDANGQYSVSYIDMRGKTVATALAGTTPQNLHSIPSYTNALKTITRQLIDPETNSVQGNSIISSKSLMVAKPGNFQFNYYLSPEKLKMMLCTGTEFCFDCLYELNVSIIPDCSDKVIAGFSNPVIKKNFNLGQYLTSCAGTQSPLLDTTFSVWLDEGAYTVVKELKLSTAARDWYREEVYLRNDTCKTRQSFILQQYQLALSQQNCYVTCTQCTQKLGSETDFINRFRLESGLPDSVILVMMPQIQAAYQAAKANCDEICDDNTGETIDELTSIKEIMLQDMMPPFGQYARTNDVDHPGYQMQPFNIFNPSRANTVTSTPPTIAPYRLPVTYDAVNNTTAPAAGYTNQYGIVVLPQAQAAAMTVEAFADDFQDSYATNLLYYHPEFCKLRFAEANLKGTYRFAGRVQNTETWSQAVTRQFIHPSTTNPVVAADYFMQKDSFFIMLGTGSPYYTEMRNAIISNYAAASPSCPNSVSMGMWRLAQLSVFCHKEMQASSTIPPNGNNCFTPTAAFLSCYNSLTNLPPSGVGHCAADMDMVWKNFKALYLSYRNILISRYLSNNCTSINYSIFSSSNGYNYQERFVRLQNTAPYIIGNASDLGGLVNSNQPGDYTAAAAAEADSICRSNSATWMSRLRRCPGVETIASNSPFQWAQDSAWLSKYLVRICKPGVDYMGHPFGAASLPDNQPAIFIQDDPNGTTIAGIPVRNFPALITYYLNFRGISIDAFCYPELVDFPKAYNVAPPTVSVPLVTVPEPCACERINYFKTKWQQSGGSMTFSNYLRYMQGTIISADTLNMLVEMCTTGYTGTNPNCNFLTAPIKLPAIFQCRGTANIDSSKTCITCADYNQIRQQFQQERGVSAPINNPATAQEVAINQAFQDYANYKTGFNKLWPEYVAFGIACANDQTLSCAHLNELLAAYYATNPPLEGNECRENFVLFMNGQTGLSLTYEGWMQQFVQACGSMPVVCRPKMDCENIQSVITDYYHTYGYRVWEEGDCRTRFAEYFNSRMGTNYTYEEIQEKYTYLCNPWCSLDVCSFPNSHLLTILYNDYKAQMMSDGPYTECRDGFVNWFNSQMNTTYSWDEIKALYQMYRGKEVCVPDLNQLCTLPYSCKQLSELIRQFYEKYPGTLGIEDCRGKMEDFINKALGTKYTYEEIKALFESVCGTPFPGCNGEIDWDCRKLLSMVNKFICTSTVDRCQCFRDYFNLTYHTAYTYEEIQKIYWEHCGFKLNMCPVEPVEFTCDQLQKTLKEFFVRYPRGGMDLDEIKCTYLFTAFFNNMYTTSYTFLQISDIYLVQCGFTPDVCNKKCWEYKDFMSIYEKQYGSIKVPLEARRDLFRALFNKKFGFTGSGVYYKKYQGIGNEPLTYASIKEIVLQCELEMPWKLENEDTDYQLEDPEVLSGLKDVYYLTHPDGVAEDCQADFMSWFNRIMQVGYTYDKMIALYNYVLGEGSGYICNPAVLNKRVLPSGGAAISIPVNYPLLLCGLNEVLLPPPAVDTSTCKDPWQLSVSDANTKYDLYIDSLRRNFDLAWYKKCTNAKTLESFTVTYEKAEHHYTLYYYDQTGLLVRTVPPEGVDDRRADGPFLSSVKAARNTSAATPVRPSHTLPTDYRYNTLGQVVQQKTPDGGLSKFWYDRLGRLVVSQNAQQATEVKYSYTRYDVLGRITEVGQKPQSTAMTQAISRDETQLNNWVTGGSSREQITRTVYDVSYFNGDNLLQPEQLSQRNLRNRVSYTQVFDVQPTGNNYVGTHRAATYYSYDIHGNVDTLLQDYGSSQYYSNIMNTSDNRYKKIAYNYDLISGKVNMVTYQPGYYSSSAQAWVSPADQFYHRYAYDAENKLTDVYTSHDSLVWERDASYAYYRHGPLSRIVLGQQQVQGLDYSYTLQGWIKGVNTSAIGDGLHDMGADGIPGGVNGYVARDAFGYALHYFQNETQGQFDYKPIDNSVKPFANPAAAGFGFVGLYNGNISAMSVNIGKFTTTSAQEGALLYTYRYDQLNRLTKMSTYKGLNIATNSWNVSATNAYREDITYDANGNIKTYKRNGADGNLMDNLTYGYNIQSGKLVNNRLRHVKDAVSSTYSADDVDNQPDDNYGYDAIGNMTKDDKEDISGITWTVYGKIKSLNKGSGSVGYVISYTYDAAGNRISKTVDGLTTWYVKDASGNIMAVYEKRSNLNSGHLTQSEVHLYGSTRIGVFNVNRDVQNPPAGSGLTVFERGKKFFELTNHLSNVLVTVSDRKFQVDDGEYTWVYPPCAPPPPGGPPPQCDPIYVKVSNTPDGIADYYTADVINANDYYPFGMMMPGRVASISGIDYKFTVNGQEKETDLNKNITSAPYWMYDSRVAKRWNVDPRPNVSISPYNCFAANPIWFSDIKGDTIRGENGFDKAAYRAALVEQVALLEQYKKDGLPGGMAGNNKNLNLKLNEMKAALKTYDALEARKDIIVVRKGDPATNANEAWTNFNVAQNAPRIDIGTSVKDGDYFLISHEMQHVEDYYEGRFSFAADGSGGILVDIYDEVGPNNRQEIISSGIVAASPNPTTWTATTLPNKVFGDGTTPYNTLPKDKRVLSDAKWSTLLKAETVKSVNENKPQPHYYVGWEKDRAEAEAAKKAADEKAKAEGPK